MSNNTDIKQLEVSIEAAEKQVKLLEAYEALTKNKDFKLLIEETYFKDNVIRLAMLRGEHNLTAESKEEVLKELDAIALFRSFLKDIVGLGINAKRAIKESQNTLGEILEESGE